MEQSWNDTTRAPGCAAAHGVIIRTPCGLQTHSWHSCLEIAQKSNHRRLVTDADGSLRRQTHISHARTVALMKKHLRREL